MWVVAPYVAKMRILRHVLLRNVGVVLYESRVRILFGLPRQYDAVRIGQDETELCFPCQPSEYKLLLGCANGWPASRVAHGICSCGYPRLVCMIEGVEYKMKEPRANPDQILRAWFVHRKTSAVTSESRTVWRIQVKFVHTTTAVTSDRVGDKVFVILHNSFVLPSFLVSDGQAKIEVSELMN